MLLKKKTETSLNFRKANEVLSLTSKILKIMYILIFILGIYAITLIVKEWKLLPMIGNFLKLLAPLFIGIAFAWLLDPLAKFLHKKGIKRGIATLMILTTFVGIIALIFALFIPMMKEQIDEFVTIVPSLTDTLTNWAHSFVAGLDAKNATAIQDSITKSLESIGNSLSSGLPTATITFVTSFFAGLGTFVIGLIIGFYLLINFDKVHEHISAFLPRKMRSAYETLTGEINTSLRSYVGGTLLSSSILGLGSAIGFSIIGLKSPLLFALICGITNLIPYIGPYIGGFPAVVVGFTISPLTGFLTLAVVVIVQMLESFIFNPMIVSKATKIHPVVIIIGLIIFGKFFGLVGMLLATPSIAVIRIVFIFLIEKYNLFNWNGIEEN